MGSCQRTADQAAPRKSHLLPKDNFNYLTDYLDNVIMAFAKMAERRDVMMGQRQDLIGDGFDLEGSVTETPLSRTHQYRKVMKPLLERKRRARINTCLEELKDLMVFAIQSEGDAINKLEKADVLELTVQHLQKLKHQKMLHVNPALDEDRFRSGFTACANEVSRFLSSVPGVNLQFGTDLMSHLGSGLTKATSTSPLSVNTVSTSAAQSPLPLSPISDGGYNSGRDSTPSPALSVGSEDIPQHIIKQEVVAPLVSSNSSVWRPF